MMRKISLLMVTMSFLALVAAPHAAIGLSIDPSFQKTTLRDAPSVKLMVGDLRELIFCGFDRGIAFDSLIQAMTKPDQPASFFHSIDTFAFFPSTIPHFRWFDGQGSYLGSGYADLCDGFRLPFRQGGTNCKSMIPVPEPATLLLLGTALMGIAVFVRKKGT